MRLKKFLTCPICETSKIIKISIIKSNIKELNEIFDLMKCLSCYHRFISQCPSQLELDDLYKKDSPYVFGGTAQELDQKEYFIKNKFENIKPYLKHWIFKYININKGKYFEFGPGLCKLYRTFYLKGWKCQGLEPRSFIKAEGIKVNFEEIENNNDVVSVFDVLEHLVDPIEILKKINTKLKKEGKIFMTFPHSESFKSKILKDNWSMVSPLAHIHYFSKKSTKIMLEKSGYQIVLIKDFSFVELRRLLRNFIKLPIFIIKDLFKFNFKKILNRLFELIMNILDLINGDQLKVVAKKK